MNKSLLILRADADAYTGTGHFMRLLALGQGWKEVGGQTVFVTRCTNKTLLGLLQKEGFETVPVPSTHPDSRDLQTLLATADRYPDAPIVIDGYTLDAGYQAALATSGHLICALDDMGQLSKYHAHLILNPNPGAEKLKYPSSSQNLLGVSYALLRREFRKSAPKQVHAREAKNVLVLMGGADVFALNPKIIAALNQVAKPTLHLKVVCGAANPHEAEVESAAKSSPHKIEILKSTQEMDKLMAWADIAVSAAGSTALELAYMGVPSLLFEIIENQNLVAQGLQAAGAAVNLGHYENFDWKTLPSQVANLLNNQSFREKISQKAKSLVDGQGIHRTIQALLALQSSRKAA